MPAEREAAVAAAPVGAPAAPAAAPAASGAPLGSDALLALQRTAGNQAVCQAIERGQLSAPTRA